MDLFIDGEWNSFGGSLISLALVPKTGEPFYEVIERDPNVDEPIDPWVAENVIPKLGKAPVSYRHLQHKLGQFLNQFTRVRVIADWPEDIEWFCRLLITGPGERLSTPELSMEIHRVDAVSSNPHNALADAQALRDYFVLQQVRG